MKLSVIRIEQKGMKEKGWKSLFVGTLKASELLKWTRVDDWSNMNREGYQRPLVPNRVREAARYLQEEEGLFPTSVLLSVRDKARFEPDSSFDGGEAGKLYVDVDDDEKPLWIVDGQHRIAGLGKAIEDGVVELKDFRLPVVILLNTDQMAEMRQFYVINTRQKGVPADIADRHLQRMREVYGRRYIQETEPQGERAAQRARAVTVVDMLASEQGPWQNMVVVPGEEKPSRWAVKHHTVAISLVEAKVFRHPTLKALDDKDIAILLASYWRALADLLPECFESPGEYSVQKTSGVYAFHMIFPDVFERCREARDYSQEKMRDVLSDISPSAEFWLSDGSRGDPLTFGTGMKALRYLAEYLREQLRPLTLAGL